MSDNEQEVKKLAEEIKRKERELENLKARFFSYGMLCYGYNIDR